MTPLRSRAAILADIDRVVVLHRAGALGGAHMPEDAAPPLAKGSEEQLRYLTLPMALNYQRNSYKLWEAATTTWQTDPNVFDPAHGVVAPDLQPRLLRHKLALQPNKHVATWRTICQTLASHYEGSVGTFLTHHNHNIPQLLAALQKTHKAGFPYLSGNKIGHYWLYVLLQYTGLPFTGREHLSIAPDTHVIQASQRLGIVDATAQQTAIADAWRELLAGTVYAPIDIHTPLWLWSRSGFTDLRDKVA